MLIAKKCLEHGVTPGIHANAALAAKHAEAGYRMITISGDAVAIPVQAQADLKLARGGAEGTKAVYG